MSLTSILLLSTNQKECELLTKAFTNKGLIVHCIDSPADADVMQKVDNALANHADRVSLIILDLDGPQGYRMSLLTAIKQHPYSHRVPLLAFSQNNDSFFVGHIYQMGVTSVFKRPVDWEQFAQSVTSYWGYPGIRLPDEAGHSEKRTQPTGSKVNRMNYYPRSQSE
ncbi:hypothetical protein HNV11_11395 [Spirosoma taeanense]|uniref:Response regulatory domain-containing protein n=1 Tax=Spirosoma taeanense TaxID=2735870 RepID=A0A6M5Y9J2_9BACT|nr:hypothetical protein [Spirosoma taeanense]QJW89940.1 hypothetical protein HNV11_11395 [Spirosoma taeanense]